MIQVLYLLTRILFPQSNNQARTRDRRRSGLFRDADAEVRLTFPGYESSRIVRFFSRICMSFQRGRTYNKEQMIALTIICDKE